MPEHLRALTIILVLAGPVFVFAKVPACASATTAADFERRRNLWFAITLVAFLAHNFWVYIAVTAALLLFALPRESNRFAMFFFLLFAVPAIPGEIPGFGVIDHFFTIHYVRLLVLVVLLPAFLSLLTKPDTEPFGRSIADKLLAGYLVLDFVLQLRADTFTNSVRHGVFYGFTDAFLPYYVASRSLRTLGAFRDALMAFVVAGFILAATGAFEFARSWLLYTSLEDALATPWGITKYLRRGVNLRALATVGQPIALGYVLAIALGFYLYLQRSVPGRMSWGLGLLLLIAGLIGALSRGPWLGAVLILLLFIALGPSAGPRLAKLALLGVVTAMALLVSPMAHTIIDHLPFIGTIDERNVVGRQRVLEVSLQVIGQNPFFGSFHARASEEMEALRMGDGVIDIVNTYMGIALSHGFVGLGLFAGFFIAVAVGIFRAMRGIADRTSEQHLLGQALLAALLGILFMIFTVSSITVIPMVYWCVAGLGVGYVHLLAPAAAPQAARAARYQPEPAAMKSKS